MTDWHVVPDRSAGKAGVQIYRDGEYVMRIALADVGIPEHEMGLLCRWLPNKIGALLEPPVQEKQGCATCGCADADDAAADPFEREIEPEGEEEDDPVTRMGSPDLEARLMELNTKEDLTEDEEAEREAISDELVGRVFIASQGEEPFGGKPEGIPAPEATPGEGEEP